MRCRFATLWQQGTTLTQATYTGQVGQTYAFYSVAEDNVGNVEAMPTAAEATTQVVNPLSQFGITPASSSVQAGVPLTFSVTAEDGNGNPVTYYTDTVLLASSDPTAVFTDAATGNVLTGSSYTFTAADAGTHTFTVTFTQAGSPTLSVTDSALGISNSTSVSVTAAGPANVAASGGSGQSATVAAAFANPLQVTVTDAFGNPVSGVTVTFTAPASGAGGTFAGGLTTVTATTDSSGEASETFTANTVPGSYAVTASVSGIATPASFSLTNTAGAAASIDAISEEGQSAAVATAFAAPLVAEVVDQYGNPVSGASVTLTAPSSGASGTFADNGQASITLTTGANGQVSEGFIADTIAGSYAVTAALTGSTSAVSFALTNTAGAPASIKVTSGGGQKATVATAFAKPLVATVKDQYGNAVAGVTVTFTAPSSGAGGTFSNGLTTITAVTGSNGQVSETLTANTRAGGYRVSASAGGVSKAAGFRLTNKAGAAVSIVVTSGGSQSATVQTAFAKPLVATAKDQYGNAVAGVSVTFTAPSSGAGGTFSNGLRTITATTGGNGQASENFNANIVAGSYVVSAAVSGISKAASFHLTNTAGAAANQSVVQGSGQTATVNTAFALPLEVLVTDQFGSVVAGAAVTFTAPTTGASGTFTGGVSSVVVTTGSNGIAVAPTFTANGTKGSYKVKAGVGGLKALSFSLTND
jgi:hypothetical protein